MTFLEIIEPKLRRFAKEKDLTPREYEVIATLLENKISSKVMAKHLYVSTNTIKNHFQNIFKKTGASKKSEIVVMVFQFFALDGSAQGESPPTN